MVKLPSDEFIQKVRAMSDEQLLREFDVYNARMDNLSAERQQCWDRFMEINELQDELGGERQAIAAAVYYVRKLRS
jgi:hypothetical protein